MTTIGERVRARRTEMGLAQEALAQAVGCSVKTISRYERGEQKPRRGEHMEALTRALGVTESWLEYGVDAAPTTSEPVYDHEPDVVTRAIRYVFGGTWPAPDLEARIRERVELIGFGDGGDLGTLAGVVQRAKTEWEADQAGRAPRTADGTRVEPPAPREGAKAFRPRKRGA